jgi:hypothetical protein
MNQVFGVEVELIVVGGGVEPGLRSGPGLVLIAGDGPLFERVVMGALTEKRAIFKDRPGAVAASRFLPLKSGCQSWAARRAAERRKRAGKRIMKTIIGLEEFVGPRPALSPAKRCGLELVGSVHVTKQLEMLGEKLELVVEEGSKAQYTLYCEPEAILWPTLRRGGRG